MAGVEKHRSVSMVGVATVELVNVVQGVENPVCRAGNCAGGVNPTWDGLEVTVEQLAKAVELVNVVQGVEHPGCAGR